MKKSLITHSTKRSKGFRKVRKKDFDKMVEALFKIPPKKSKEKKKEDS